MSDFQILVLAAGNGSRMKADGLPKVLVPMGGQPMIKYLLDQLDKLGLRDKTGIVVSYCAELVKQTLGDGYSYIHQTERLGTGHAVRTARDFVPKQVKNLIVLYGDHPLVSDKTLSALIEKHKSGGSVLTMATLQIEDFNEWRAGFNDFGRVARDESGRIKKIVEKRDASAEELNNLREFSPSYFAFNTEWLWGNIDKLKNENAQKEYYLTDMIGMAVRGGETVNSISIEPREGLGANTPEQLKLIEGFLC